MLSTYMDVNFNKIFDTSKFQQPYSQYPYPLLIVINRCSSAGAVLRNTISSLHDELCSRKEFSPGMHKMIHRLVKVKREGSVSK